LELLADWARRATRWHQRHPRTIVAALIVSLGGFSAVAFGIAPLAPDAADLPQRLIVERIEPEGIEAQLEALATHELALTRADLTRPSDTAERLLARLGVLDDSAAAFLRTDSTARRVLTGRVGKMVQVHAADDGRLVELVARYPAERSEQALTHFTRLTMSRIAGQWQARIETAPLEQQVRLGSGTIESSLFGAADAARIPDAIAIQLAEVFAGDIDFHRELRKGDTFSVVFESLTADGEPITWNEGTGRVLAAEFVNAGKTYQAVWFPNDGGKGGYFQPDGTSKRKTFLSSPMEFSRVTSGFAMRFHPILKTWRAHKGVDYGAPTGTPIRTVGNGVVEFAGWQGGYGNAVHIVHGNGRSTFYAHMSRIDVRKGQRVEQGDRIGAVGSTGWSTGPHLHFEFRVNGQHRDPRQIAKASEAVALAPALRPQFDQAARLAQAKLAIANSMIGARVDAE
jgi:murein DD-endopeptidase MepM/ murein hydrolase activator NlpD